MQTETKEPEIAVPGDEQKPGAFSAVTVHINENIGAIFLGIVSLILIVALLKSEQRNRLLLSPT